MPQSESCTCRRSEDWFKPPTRWEDLKSLIGNVDRFVERGLRTPETYTAYVAHAEKLKQRGLCPTDEISQTMGQASLALIPNKFPYNEAFQDLNTRYLPKGLSVAHYCIFTTNDHLPKPVLKEQLAWQLPNMIDMVSHRNKPEFRSVTLLHWHLFLLLVNS